MAIFISLFSNEDHGHTGHGFCFCLTNVQKTQYLLFDATVNLNPIILIYYYWYPIIIYRKSWCTLNVFLWINISRAIVRRSNYFVDCTSDIIHVSTFFKKVSLLSLYPRLRRTSKTVFFNWTKTFKTQNKLDSSYKLFSRVKIWYMIQRWTIRINYSHEECLS